MVAAQTPPMPPATAADVLAGTATYKAITPKALSDAGIATGAALSVGATVEIAATNVSQGYALGATNDSGVVILWHNGIGTAKPNPNAAVNDAVAGDFIQVKSGDWQLTNHLFKANVNIDFSAGVTIRAAAGDEYLFNCTSSGPFTNYFTGNARWINDNASGDSIIFQGQSNSVLYLEFNQLEHKTINGFIYSTGQYGDIYVTIHDNLYVSDYDFLYGVWRNAYVNGKSLYIGDSFLESTQIPNNTAFVNADFVVSGFGSGNSQFIAVGTNSIINIGVLVLSNGMTFTGDGGVFNVSKFYHGTTYPLQNNISSNAVFDFRGTEFFGTLPVMTNLNYSTARARFSNCRVSSATNFYAGTGTNAELSGANFIGSSVFLGPVAGVKVFQNGLFAVQNGFTVAGNWTNSSAARYSNAASWTNYHSSTGVALDYFVNDVLTTYSADEFVPTPITSLDYFKQTFNFHIIPTVQTNADPGGVTVGSTAVKKWIPLKDEDGNILYVPAY